MDDEGKALLRWMNRHLVSLVLIYWHLDENGNSKGKPFVNANSGFIMTFGDAWFLVTAGHVIEELDELASHRFVKIVDCFLVDSLGSQATHRNNIPFNYEESLRCFEYHDGIDCGFIWLNPNEIKLLQANDVQPIGVENWIKQDIDKCKGFMLLGIPAELVGLDEGGEPQINIGTFASTVKRLPAVPEGAEDTPFERFIGELQ
ncbi:MAG: hypothetical protein KF777_18180, partial [Planctomycetaceae bacterium]|nr:hypothetical protein [Planctomycetaceae bacterium]